MKSTRSALLVSLVAGGLLGFSWGSSKENDAVGVLQVHVTIPPTPNPTAEDRVGDRFVDEVVDTFKTLGFSGKVERLDDLDKPKPGAPILRITLTDWSRDHTRNVNCRFSATIESGGKQQALGSFEGMDPVITEAPGRFGASRAFDDAAATALRSLFKALAKTDLVPGLREQ